MLRVEEIHTYYGLSHILFGVSLEVHPGEVVALLGRNGAGKSTTMKSIMNMVPPRQGQIIFKGETCRGRKPFQIARKGVGYVPDDRRVFADLSVVENLEITARCDRRSDWNVARVFEFFPALGDIRQRRAGFLSGGEQQMLTIARALMTNPDLLLLDEPTEGLAPLIVRALIDNILRLKQEGLTVLIAEQNLMVALELSDRAYIIDNGAIRYHGTSNELRADQTARQKYLCV
jgi:branched-chain amino acid transport system ATP-binding protein